MWGRSVGVRLDNVTLVKCKLLHVKDFLKFADHDKTGVHHCNAVYKDTRRRGVTVGPNIHVFRKIKVNEQRFSMQPNGTDSDRSEF